MMFFSIIFRTTAVLLPAVAAAPQHLRFSGAYAWNTSTLASSYINLAQASSVASAAALAQRGISSALAAFQGSIFVRSHELPGGSKLVDGWEQRVDKLIADARPLIRPGAIEAAFLGDELCCHNPACLDATLGPVTRRLRKLWPDRSSLLIWTNECDSTIVGGHGVAPLPNRSGAIPEDLDVLSVDIYVGVGDDGFRGAAEVANVSGFLEREVFPRMRARQRAMVVPGLFGCTNVSVCGSLDTQEARLRDKLGAYRAYLESEGRVLGLAPWHLDDRGHEPCDVRHKPKCHGCDMRLGAASFPSLMADWRAFGASIVATARGAGRSRVAALHDA